MEPSQPDKIVGKFLDKIPTDKVYDDALAPGLREAGKALSAVTEFVGTLLTPLKAFNVYGKVWLEKYEERLRSRGIEPITVPPAIGVPIVQKLLLLEENKLSEAFLNLLENASFEDSIHKVHPAFVTTLADLSTDEAKILFELNGVDDVPFICIETYTNHDKSSVQKPNFWTKHYDLGTGLEYNLDLIYPQNIILYLLNLGRLGIFEQERSGRYANKDAEYDRLEFELYAGMIKKVKQEIEDKSDDSGTQRYVHVKRFGLSKTAFGRSFTEACINK